MSLRKSFRLEVECLEDRLTPSASVLRPPGTPPTEPPGKPEAGVGLPAQVCEQEHSHGWETAAVKSGVVYCDLNGG